jgi:hypothetical protein
VLALVIDQQQDGIVETSAGNALQPSSTSSDSGASLAEAFVRFTIDGKALRDNSNRVMEFTLPLPPRSELYPTLTLHSQDVHVFSQMSAPDITRLNLRELELPTEAPEIWCLDGLRLGVAA